MNQYIYRSIKTICFIFLRLFNRLEVIGSENIPDEGGIIVAANHLSYMDPPVISVALKRRPLFIAKEGLFRIPLLGRFIRHFSFPVERSRPKPSTIKETISRLKRGDAVVVFPEGGRSVDGNLLDAKRGVGMIATLSMSPVVPAFIEGTERALPVGAKFLRPAKIRVIFGTPIQIEIEKKKTDKNLHGRISREVLEAIKDLKIKVEAKAKKKSSTSPLALTL